MFGNIAPFFDVSYLFNFNPVTIGPSLVGQIFAFLGWFALITIGLFIYALVVKNTDNLKRLIARRASRLFGLTALFGYLFLFFAYEQVPIFNMRFWLVLIFIGFSAELVNLAVFVVRDYPKLKEELQQQHEYKKYLPKQRA